MTRPLWRPVPLRAKGHEAIAGRELGAFAACHAIVAAIVEDLDAKRQLFAELEALEKFAISAVIDGVFSECGGALCFHPASALGDADVAAVERVVATRVLRLFERRGV